MPREVYQFGEMMPDSYGLQADVLQSVINMRPEVDGYAPDTGFSAQTGTTTNAVIGAFEARYNNTGHPFCGDSSKLYSFNEAGNPGFTDRSAAAYTAGDFWDFAQFGSTVIAVTGGTSTSPVPQAVTVPVAGNFAAIAGSPPSAACCAIVRDWLVLGHTYDATDGEQATRIRWSGNNQLTQWPTDAATKAAVLSDWQDLKQEGGDVMRIVGGAEGIIFQQTMITRMVPTGDQRQFQFETINDHIGTRSARSVVGVSGSVYFWSGAAFFRIGRDGSIAPIGAGKVDKTFAALSSPANNYRNISAAFSNADNTINWTVSNASYLIFRYHIDFNKWTLLDTSVMGLSIIPNHLLSAKRGQQDTILWMFGDATDKKLYKKSGLPPFQIDTSEKRLNGDGVALVQLARPLQKGAVTSPGIAPLTRMTQEESQTTGAAFSQHATHGYFQGRSAARYHAFRYTGTYVAANQSVAGIEVEFTPQGRR